MSNTHVAHFFEEFRKETNDGGKWMFIREERGTLRPFRFGHTRTYRRIVTMLQLRAVCKYQESRVNHGSAALMADEKKIQALLEYNQRRYDPLNYYRHLHDASTYQLQLEAAQSQARAR